MENILLQPRQEQICADSLILRPFADSDEEDVMSILLNDEVKKTYMLPDFKSREEAKGLFKRLQKMSLSDDRFVYAVTLDTKVIGIFNEVEKNGDTIEVGYAIHPDYKNQGFATMALGACIKELKRIGYKTVRAGYFEENTASARVMEKCAMKMTNQTDEIEYRQKIHKCRYFEI